MGLSHTGPRRGIGNCLLFSGNKAGRGKEQSLPRSSLQCQSRWYFPIVWEKQRANDLALSSSWSLRWLTLLQLSQATPVDMHGPESPSRAAQRTPREQAAIMASGRPLPSPAGVPEPPRPLDPVIFLWVISFFPLFLSFLLS